MVPYLVWSQPLLPFEKLREVKGLGITMGLRGSMECVAETIITSVSLSWLQIIELRATANNPRAAPPAQRDEAIAI